MFRCFYHILLVRCIHVVTFSRGFLFFFFWLPTQHVKLLHPEIQPRLPAFQVWSLHHWTTREVCRGFLMLLSTGNPLTVQWFRLCASTAVGTASILGQETKIPHTVWHDQEIKNKLK